MWWRATWRASCEYWFLVCRYRFSVQSCFAMLHERVCWQPYELARKVRSAWACPTFLDSQHQLLAAQEMVLDDKSVHWCSESEQNPGLFEPHFRT